MKKVILGMVFVFATGTMMNATSSNEEIKTSKIEVIEVVEDFGCASDCVRSARATILEASETLGEDPNDHMDDYMLEYGYCYYNNCVQ